MKTRKGLILALCCAAQFMVVLDIAIVNVALPSIKADLGLSEGGLEWIVVAYGLMLAGFVLLGRRLGDVLGGVTVTAGLLLFVYGLNHGSLHGWASAGTIGSFAAAAALLAAFIRVESRSRQPLVPFAALRNRTMVAADLTAFLLFGAFF